MKTDLPKDTVIRIIWGFFGGILFTLGLHFFALFCFKLLEYSSDELYLPAFIFIVFTSGFSAILISGSINLLKGVLLSDCGMVRWGKRFI